MLTYDLIIMNIIFIYHLFLMPIKYNRNVPPFLNNNKYRIDLQTNINNN